VRDEGMGFARGTQAAAAVTAMMSELQSRGGDKMRELDRIIAEIDRFDRECREAEYTDTAEAWAVLNEVRDLAARALAQTAEVAMLWAPGEEPGVWVARRGTQATLLLLDAGSMSAGAETPLAALFDALGIVASVRPVEVNPVELAGAGWDWEAVARAWLAREWPGCSIAGEDLR
jgi:hypothetical protein